MSWKLCLIYGVLFFQCTDMAQAQPGKKVFLKKMCLLNGHDLVHYVDEFLENNAITPECLSVMNNDTLLRWSYGLAHTIEKRYASAPSTLVNRALCHEEKILKILKKRRHQAQTSMTQETINWSEVQKSSADATTLRVLLDRYEQGEEACSKAIEQIECKLEKMHPEDEAEKIRIHQSLVAIIEDLHAHHHSVLESFSGAPGIELRKKLAAQRRIFSQETQDLNQTIQALLRHGQVLHRMNQSMNQHLRFIFSNTHLGITPYADKAMGLKCEMFEKAIRELGALRANLPIEKQTLFDMLCRFVAVQLWTKWMPLVRTEQVKLFAQQNAPQQMLSQNSLTKGVSLHTPVMPNVQLFVSNKPLDQQGDLEQLLSPFHHHVTLPLDFLNSACEHILTLLNMAEKGFSEEIFCKTLAAKTPSMLRQIAQMTQTWLKSMPLSEPMAAAARIELKENPQKANIISTQNPNTNPAVKPSPALAEILQTLL